MIQQQTGKTYIQKLQTFAYTSLGLPLLFFIYLYLESSIDRLEPSVGEAYLLYFSLPMMLLAGLIVFISQRKYQSFKSVAISKTDFKEKLYYYRKGSNTRFLFYGFATSLITLGFYITNFQPFAALFGIMIVFFSIHNPNARKIVNDLKLKDEEKTIILSGLEIP